MNLPDDVDTGDVRRAIRKIGSMSQLDMCRHLRNDPPGSIFFRQDLPTVRAAWVERIQKVGGMTPAISKRLSRGG